MGDGELVKHLIIYQSNQSLDQFDRSQWDDGAPVGQALNIQEIQGWGRSMPGACGKFMSRPTRGLHVDFHERNWPIEHLVHQKI